MKKQLRNLAIAFASILVVAGLVYSANGPYPSIGLYWIENVDPTVGGGVSAPLNQLLIRTDNNSLYYKSGNANTAWSVLANGGTGITGALTAPHLPVATGAQTIADSVVQQSSTQISVVGREFISTDTATVQDGGGNPLFSTTVDNTGATLNVLTRAQTLWGAHVVSKAEAGTVENFACTTAGIKVEQSSATCIVGAALDVPSFIEMNSHKIVDLTDPTNPQDAASKNYVDTKSASVGASINYGSFFCDGTDGDVTCFDGSTTCLGLTPSSGVYTMNRDICAHNITIGVSADMKEAGYRIFATGIGTVNGKIESDGGNGGNGQNNGCNGGGAGSPPQSGVFAASLGGINGAACGSSGSLAGTNNPMLPLPWVTNHAATSAGQNGQVAFQGGGGGNGQSGLTGGGGGQIGIGAASQGAATIDVFIRGISHGGSALQAPGTAGGGGAGGVLTTGGGGGGGGSPGGFCFLAAQTITGSGVICSANGGNGGNGSSGTGGVSGGGGGGAGGGGWSTIIFATYTGSGTIRANGGTHGTGGVGGSAGGDGLAGLVRCWNLSGDNTKPTGCPP